LRLTQFDSVLGCPRLAFGCCYTQADEKIKALLDKLDDQRRRRAFLLGFSHAPTEFIDSMVASQAREVRHVSTTQPQMAEAPLRHEVFQGKWVEDAAMRYLSQRAQAQRNAQVAAQAARMRPLGYPPGQPGAPALQRPPPGAAMPPQHRGLAAQPMAAAQQLALAPAAVIGLPGPRPPEVQGP